MLYRLISKPRCYRIWQDSLKKILAFLLLTPLFAHAGWGEFEYEFDNEKPWQELQTQLPPYPQDENLLPFFVSAATDNRFFIDRPSISVAEDGVVRYTLLVKSSTGATTVSFEGIRCSSHEKKIYALGRNDGVWSRARTSKWEEIEFKDRNRQHHMLYDDFFCPNGIIIRNPDAAIKALKADAHF